MFGSINKTFGCFSQIFGCSNKKFICCPLFCCRNKTIFFRVYLVTTHPDLGRLPLHQRNVFRAKTARSEKRLQIDTNKK